MRTSLSYVPRNRTYTLHTNRRITVDVALLVDRRPDTSWQARHVDVADAEVCDGVDDCVDEHRRTEHAGTLTDPLASERVVRRRGAGLHELVLGGLPSRRQH